MNGRPGLRAKGRQRPKWLHPSKLKSRRPNEVHQDYSSAATTSPTNEVLESLLQDQQAQMYLKERPYQIAKKDRAFDTLREDVQLIATLLCVLENSSSRE